MELMTRHEAAHALRIGLRTLDRRLAAGDIKCYRLGEGPRAPVRISEAQLREYLESGASEVTDGDREQARVLLSRRRAV